MMIRGMNATVFHGDTLSRNKVKGVFFVQNDRDDHMLFSSLNLMPYNEATRNEFSIMEWADAEDRHKPIKDTKEFPEYLVGNMARDRVLHNDIAEDKRAEMFLYFKDKLVRELELE